jgi:hypothetical protein
MSEVLGALSLKDEGNARIATRDFAGAEASYSQGLSALDEAGGEGENVVLRCLLLSNRSAARAGLGNWPGALADADACVAQDAAHTKGHMRRGIALAGSHKFLDAAAAYEQAATCARGARDDVVAGECDSFAELCRLRAAKHGQSPDDTTPWDAAQEARVVELMNTLGIAPEAALPRWRLRHTFPPCVLRGLSPMPASPAKLWQLDGAPGAVRHWAGSTKEGNDFIIKLEVGPNVASSIKTKQLPATACPWGMSASAPLGDTLLLFGGVTPLALVGTQYSNELWAVSGMLDVGRDAAPPPAPARVPVAAGEAPVRRVLASAAALGGVFYLVGGSTHASAAHPAGASGHAALWDAWTFTPRDAARPAAGGAWARLQLSGARPAGDVPGLVGACAVALPQMGEILLIAGQTNIGYSGEVYALNVASGAVRILEPPHGTPRPSARMGASAALLPGDVATPRVLFTGGGTNTVDAADAWVFDVVSQRWSEIAMDNPRAEPELSPGMVPEFSTPPIFGQDTLMGVASAGAGNSVDVVAWGGMAYDLGAGTGAVAALKRGVRGVLGMQRVMCHPFLHAMRLEQLP